jgi:predicted membrane protein
VSVLIIAPVFMGKAMAMGALIIAFLGSTILGSILALFALKLLRRAGFTPSPHPSPPGKV